MSSKKRTSQFLKGLAQYRVEPGLETRVVNQYLEALNCPRALTVKLLVENHEYAQLFDLEVDPLDYNDPYKFRSAYKATKFLSKYPDFPVPWDVKKVAFEKFFEFEELCKQTNTRFRSQRAAPKSLGRLGSLHHGVIRKIAEVLGEFNPSEFVDFPDWGPGASTLIKRRDASATEKFQHEVGITRDLHTLFPLDTLVGLYPHWGEQLRSQKYPQFEVGNKVTTVPKDSKTDRVIAIEPGINLWFQASIGDMIRRRLSRFGVDLRRQEINQHASYFASKFGDVATVDLSSASDSIALELVREVLPLDWFYVMDITRSQYGSVAGDQIRKWEKFSSMGNGFTFPLESLFFYCMAFCCTVDANADIRHVHVYGDDILIPVEAMENFRRLCEFYGFRINEKKTHFLSPFRESCGAHYYAGVNVKPILLKEELGSLQSVFRLANSIRRGSSLGSFCDGSFRAVHHTLVSSVPKALRFWVPEGLGDGGFVSNFDEAVPERARYGIEGYLVRHVMDVGLTYESQEEGFFLASLWRDHGNSRNAIYMTALAREPFCIVVQKCRLELQNLNDHIRPDRKSYPNQVTRHNATRVKVVRSLVNEWCDIGQWIG